MINSQITSRFILLFISLLLSTPGFTKDLGDYLFSDIKFEQSHYLENHNQFILYFEGENFIAANSVMIELTEKILTDTTVSKATLARVLNNSAISNAKVGNTEAAISKFDEAIILTEASNHYNLHLARILMAKALVHQSKNDYKLAEDALRRTQHIFHRHSGVYAEDQLPVLEALTDMELQRRDYTSADREQFFRLRISEEVFGRDSEEIIPTLQSLGIYFASRATAEATNMTVDQAIYRDKLFKQSISLFERGITIIEDKYDVNDLRLVSLLQGLSKTRFLHGSSYPIARQSMERATNIISNSPSTDIYDHVKSLVALGDTYLVTQDARSLDAYSQAWNLLDETPEKQSLRDQFFGEPKLLYPDVLIRPVLARQPSNTKPGDELFVHLVYEVRQNGKVRNIQVVNGNVPNNQKKLLRNYVSKMRYRPRLVDGQAITTEGIELRQIFKVAAHRVAMNRPTDTRLKVAQEIPSREIPSIDGTKADSANPENTDQ